MNREEGFALVELLASLVILGMISMMIVGGVGTGRRVWDGLDAAAGAGEAVASAQSVLRERIEHAWPVTDFGADQPFTDFDGEVGSMEFVAPPVASRGPDALRRFSLGLTPAGDLVLASSSDLAADIQHPPLQTMTLVKGVQALEIEYFGAAAPDNQPHWRARWDQQPRPPLLVRIRLAFAPNDRRRWPDLVIHPAATIDSQCILNTATGHCQGRAS